MNPDIFISYKREDLPLAKTIADALSHQGWNVWWDHDIPAGKDYDTVIQDNISNARCVIVLWSEKSINSRNVKDEANVGLERNVLIPVLIGDVKAPIGFRMIQAVMCSNNIIDKNKIKDITYQVKLMIGDPGANKNKDGRQYQELKQAAKKMIIEEDGDFASTELKHNTPANLLQKQKKALNAKKIISVVLLLIVIVYASYEIITVNFFANTDKSKKPVNTTAQVQVQDNPIVEEKIPAPIRPEEKTITSTEVLYEKNKLLVVEKPKKKTEPTEVKIETTLREVETPVKEVVNNPAVESAPKSKSELKNDITGTWRTNENKIWKIKQSGNEINITFCNKNGDSIDEVDGKLDGHYLAYNADRRGKNKEGAFTVSADYKNMTGKMKLLFGMYNRLTLTKEE